MKSKYISLFAGVAVVLAATFTGCESMQRGVPQEVVILSFPTEASVYINGEPIGITPIVTKLPRKVTHEVRLEKYGYNSAVKYFSPVPNDKSQNLIRFGLSEDLGYYVDLEPRKMETQMKSGLVPTSTGSDPFERMAKQALEADRRLEAGEITPLEHKTTIEQILEFFEQSI
ncbi:MAG: PEGA domain-containing protein [Opitutaceae bacterium]